MSESSGASFPGFGSEEVCDLPTTETVTGSGETPRATCIQANADQGEVLSRQGSAVMPPRGDSPPYQAILIRDLIREELRRGLGRYSERESSVSSSSSQEGCRSMQSQSFRHRSRALSRSRRSRYPSRRSNRSRVLSCSSYMSGGSSHSPWCCLVTPRWSPWRTGRTGPPPRLLSAGRHRHLLLRSSCGWLCCLLRMRLALSPLLLLLHVR